MKSRPHDLTARASLFPALLLASVSLFALVACRQPDVTRQTTGAATPANKTPSSPSTPSTNPQSAPADAVRVEVEPISVRRGASAEATVRFTIAERFHVNANPATHSYLIPTQLSLRATEFEGLNFGAPVYPEGVMHKFAFDESPLRVYEGTTEIRLPVRAAPDAAPGGRAVPIRLRVQPCDDEVCYPPRTIEATIPVTVSE